MNVFDTNGGDLPTSDDGDPMLAQNVKNNHRVEAFPFDPDGFVLPVDRNSNLMGPLTRRPSR